MARDQRGNTLAIVAAITLPMLAMVGSGIDMSRAYMAQARLQQACDAAALAGRRAMSDGTVDQAVTDEAKKFFNFNFPQGTFKTAAFTPIVTGAAESTVVVDASTTIPTAIMRIFGFQTLPLNVTCNAKQDFVNTDIVLVLDTTGSMDQNVGGIKKIVSLRAAVLALYDELKPVQDQLAAGGLRMRYGLVPYSTTVNVGKIVRGINANYIVSDAVTYQSREAKWNYGRVQGPTSDPIVEVNSNGSISRSQCESWGENSSGSNPEILSGGPPPSPTTEYNYSNNAVDQGTPTATNTDWGWSGASDTSGNNRSCRRTRTTSSSTYDEADKTFVSWEYKPVSYDVSQYVTGASVTTETGSNGADVSSTWAGCIEERQTTSITSSSGYTIPSNAYDLDIDKLPTDNASRWAPLWPEVGYNDDHDRADAPCPTEAKKLQTWTRADLETYVNGLNPTGNTYHDIGMIWGARFISRNGVFQSSNPTTHNSMPVSLHLIFMSDGQLEPNPEVHTAYGIEELDERITGGGGTANSNHNQRFKMICNATKAMNVSIWVVAFSTGLSSEMTECASSSSQASVSTNQAQLIEKFVEIGKNIGSLRLTQ